MSKGFRDYCFTVNNPDEADYVWLTDPVFTYIIIGFEVGESNTPHFQGYCRFKDAKTLSALKKIHPRAHWEPRRGTIEQAIEYCRKDGLVTEYGTKPMSQKDKGKKGEEFWRANILAVAEKRWQDVHPEMLARNLNGMKTAAELLHPTKLEPVFTKHLWLWGQTRCGKSRLPRKRWEENLGIPIYQKRWNQWWNKYEGQEVVMLNDMDPSHAHHLQDIKEWADCHPFPVEVKSSYIGEIRPKLLIVTSNHHPSEIFTGATINDADREAVLRRFHIVHMYEPWDERPEDGGVLTERQLALLENPYASV